MSKLFLGDKIKSIRESKGLTQQQMAEKIGVVKGTISAYEQNTKYPSLDILIKICNLFRVSSDYMLGISDDMAIKGVPLTDEQMDIVIKVIMELKNYNELKDTTTTK